MKLLYRLLCLLGLCAGIQPAFAQCTAASLNWDALDFLQEGANVSNALATNQKFAFGTNRLIVTHNYAAANMLGENGTNTAETGSYGTGTDVQFKGNGTLTLTFASSVQNVKFSLYDIDVAQKVAITASNGALAQNVSLTTIGATTHVLRTGSGTTLATAFSDSVVTTKPNKTTYSAVANTSTDGTVNVDVAGPVTSITLTISNTHTEGGEDGSFWLSDVAACITNTAFPTGYHAISKPYTGQPSYIMAARNNEVYMIDPSNGNAKLLFADPTLKNINSMGYDPYNRILYYTYSLTGSGGTANATNKTINKYDFKTDTYGTFVPDVTTLGIPVFGSGVESGGASFYDGAFYIGVEGSNSVATDESIVWRIDMNASGNATTATQVFGTLTSAHDWGDYVIANGMLYDFDGKASAEDIYHYNLQTGALQQFPISTAIVRQVSVDWNDQVYNMGGAPASTGEVTKYNYTGTIDTLQRKAVTAYGVAITGSWGDAASAFKPKSDFGDAPSSYDPVALSPAMHDPDINLRLGPTLDYEWGKPTTLGTIANADGTDEDGLTFVRILNMSGGRYQTDVNVFNNTGANATLAAWIDFNNNGIFEASEGIVQTVTSAATSQSKSLYWTGITTNLPANSNSYMRIRVTSAANGMTTSSATGYFPNGEVEDYFLPVNSTTLASAAVTFEAKKILNNTVIVNWQATGIAQNTTYEVERSEDGRTFTTINQQTAVANRVVYTFTDVHPPHGVVYYRLKYNTAPTVIKYTNAQKLTFSNTHTLQVYPNPAVGQFHIAVATTRATRAQVALQDGQGRFVFTQAYAIAAGTNALLVIVPPSVPAGFYTVTLTLENTIYTEKVLLGNQP